MPKIAVKNYGYEQMIDYVSRKLIFRIDESV